ncbi:MAG: sigma-70 family RNA polymerase sigma factor [Gemmatimonadota bacterium]|jgi:RNA polymerase sigma factor (TIGR02999 family)
MPDPDIAPPDGPDAGVTQLLLACRDGGAAALDRLFPILYERLRQVANAHLRGGPEGSTVSTTALVHEAYVKLVDAERVDWRDRAHFLSLASRAMRQILIDHARKHRAQKRGGGRRRVDLDAVQIAVLERADTLVALDEALSSLSRSSPRLAQVVEHRFFGGLTEEETAQVLGVTDRTVRRDWIKARGWLHQELARGGLES